MPTNSIIIVIIYTLTQTEILLQQLIVRLSILAGCIPLAQNGICFIQNMAQLRKEQKQKLQNGIYLQIVKLDVYIVGFSTCSLQCQKS